MTNCKLCFNCVATIPLQYPAGNLNILSAQLMYNKAKIRCKKGYWVKDSDGKEKIYQNLSRFVDIVKISNQQRGCPDYEV